VDNISVDIMKKKDRMQVRSDEVRNRTCRQAQLEGARVRWYNLLGLSFQQFRSRTKRRVVRKGYAPFVLVGIQPIFRLLLDVVTMLAAVLFGSVIGVGIVYLLFAAFYF
jgi:hypothetical protein